MGARDTIQQCKERLVSYYGDRLAGVILYGSEARGESNASSDIDLLVLLRGSLDRLTELRTIVDLLYPVQLDSNRLISARPASLDEYEESRLQLYRNVQEEGVAV